MQCDEAKPRCGKCIKTNSACVYSAAANNSPKTLFVDERTYDSPSMDMYSMSVDLVETDLDSLLNITSSLDFSDGPTSSVRILQHFSSVTSLTLGGTMCRAVMHSFVSQKAWDSAHLMHMVLTVSSAHLKRLHSDASQLWLQKQFSVAEAAHWEAGLQLYRQALNGDKPDFDATVATTFLTVIFRFSLDDNIPQDSFSGGDEDKLRHAIDPLAATGGFRALRDIFGQFMNSSVWRTVLRGSDDDTGTFSNADKSGVEGLPAALVDLCELDAHSTNENNEYHYILRLLTPLLCFKPHFENFTKLIAFSGRTWSQFQPLVLRRDPRGLLLLAYWFASLRQVDQWWLTQRAKSGCMAIVTYLAQFQDPKINVLLAYPASFGEADLSYIWHRPDCESDTSAIFERYFTKSLTPTHPTLYGFSLRPKS